MENKQSLSCDEFVYAHKTKAMRYIVKQLLESLCACGFTTDELLYALADIFEDRSGLDKAVDYLRQAAEYIPLNLAWGTKENAENQ